MQLTILNVAFPFAPVSRNCVGGAEQIVSQLDAALVRANHKSIVIAQAGSCVRGELLPLPKIDGTLSGDVCRSVRAECKCKIEAALATRKIDLVHLHGVDFSDYLPTTKIPVLVTLHLPPGFYPDGALQNLPPNVHLHCVSKSQARACAATAKLLPVVENGIDVDAFDASHAKRKFALSLGRICPEKGFHIALDAAKRADIPFVLAGETFAYETHQNYFRDEILPRLDGKRKFIGPIGFTRKRRLLSAARCLLVSSLCAETSSLVAMESLACGTPVIAFPNGALADIIEHGKTGFLVDDEREMAAAIRVAEFISRDACREAARKRFAFSRMADNFFEIYERLARHDDAVLREIEEAGCVA